MDTEYTQRGRPLICQTVVGYYLRNFNLARCQTVGPGRDESSIYVYRGKPAIMGNPEGAGCIVSAIQ